MRPRLTALVLCSWLMVACGSGGEDDGAGGGGGGSPTPATRTHAFAASDCAEPDYPEPLGVETDVLEEIDYLDDVIACTNSAHSAVWLSNKSDAVWEIYLNSEKKEIQGTATAFRTMFGDTAFSPGDAITFPSYQLYEWHVDKDLSAAWVGFDLMQSEFQAFSEEAAANALNKRTPIGAAVLTCSLAFRDAGGLKSSADGAVLLKDVFEVGASGAQCRESVGTLHYTNASGEQVTILEDLTRLKGQTATVERISQRLTYASAAAKFGKFLLQLK